MNTTKEPFQSTTTPAQPRRCHAIAMIAGGAAAIALFAFVGTTGPGAPETSVASGTAQLMDSATPAPLQVQDVDDDSDDEAALQQQNNATQMMIQAEQQAEEQNEQAQQQALQDELQAQQTEQQADQ
jgi:preprotein translocase subunit SecF